MTTKTKAHLCHCWHNILGNVRLRGTISIFRLGRETGVVSKRAVTDFWCLAPGVEYGDHPQTSHAGMAQKNVTRRCSWGLPCSAWYRHNSPISWQ